MSASDEPTAEDVAWLRKEMNLAYHIAGIYRTALERVCSMAGSHTTSVPDDHPAGFGAIYRTAQGALDETWGIANRAALTAQGETDD